MKAQGRELTALAMLGLLCAAPACVRAHAKTAPDVPALEMPAPPARDVDPPEAEATPTPTAGVGEPTRGAAPRPRPATPPPPRPEPPKPETPPETKPPDEPRTPPGTLQTGPATSETERAIGSTLSRANADLNRVDYRRLNADARVQYDTAKRFIRQADDALRAKNLVFAKNLADKAAALAAQLSSR